MDFSLTKEQVELKEKYKIFAQKEIAPIAFDVDEKAQFSFDSLKKLAEIGFLGLVYPKEYGGQGKTLLEAIIAVEELAKECPSTTLSCGVSSTLFAYHIFNFGTNAQKEKYIPGIIKGEIIGAWALTEPEAGSDAASITTTAVKKNGNYIVNGTKIFISNAPIANVVIVMAKTDPEKGARGISAIIVEKDAPGFNKGITLDKMGFRGLQVGELIFENCTVSEENLLGKEGLGFLQAMKVLEQGRVAVASVGVAIAQACLEESVTRSNKRIQFGKPISNFQLIQQKLSDMKVRIDASRLLTYKAACLISNKKPCAVESSVAKLFSTETANFCANEAVQIFGGYGYIKKYKDRYKIERMYRDAKLLEIVEGTSEVQRMIISRHLTR